MNKRKKSTKEFKPNPWNPRKITDKRLTMLENSLEALGDLSGVVYNIASDTVIGGNQRIKVFREGDEANITYTKTFDKPTKDGTVAFGYIEWRGQFYSYREVVWDSKTEKIANLAANEHGGERHDSMTTDIGIEIDDGATDMELTGIENFEWEELMNKTPNPPSVTDEKSAGRLRFSIKCESVKEMELLKEFFGVEGISVEFADIEEKVSPS